MGYKNHNDERTLRFRQSETSYRVGPGCSRVLENEADLWRRRERTVRDVMN
jgi:hypothetical protein